VYGGRTEESYHSRYDRNYPLVPPPHTAPPCRPAHSIALIYIYILYTVYLIYRVDYIEPRESSCGRMCTCIVTVFGEGGGWKTSLIKCIPTRCQIQSSENPAVVRMYACVCLPSAIKLIAVPFERDWITKPIL